METDKTPTAFIPKKFVIGLDENGYGFPSMKDKDGKWTNLNVFEKHSGYKPHTQKDARKEINKVLTQRVQEVDNVPTSGFKIVDVAKCAYNTAMYKDVRTIMVQDPRGWTVGVPVAKMQSILQRNGFNLKDGEIVGLELMYKWSIVSIVPFSLDVADDEAKQIQEDTDKFLNTRNSALKPSEFEVGKVYSSKTSKLAGHLYMYLGKHDVYSSDCHLKAVMTGSYSHFSEFAAKRNDMTGEGMHVFYCVDLDKTAPAWRMRDNVPGVAPYYVASSISKLLDTCELVDTSKFMMYNDDSRPCTYENVKRDMENCAYFNKVDFSKTYECAADCQALEDVFISCPCFHNFSWPECNAKAFPFSASPRRGIRLLTDDGRCDLEKPKEWKSSWGYFGLTTFNEFSLTLHYDKFAVVNGSNFITLIEHKMSNTYDPYGRQSYVYKQYKFDGNGDVLDVFRRMYSEVKPKWRQHVFCNGNEVPPYQNLQLNELDARFKKEE